MLSRDQAEQYLEKRRARARAATEKRATLPCEAYPLLFVSDDRLEQRTAASLCDHCPINKTCDTLALELKPALGVWAGRPWRNGRPLRSRRQVPA